MSSKPVLLRVVAAGDMTAFEIGRIANTFAIKNNIEQYEMHFEVDESLIGGFVIYALGTRYDYSVKGQLQRLGTFVKRSRNLEEAESEEDIVFSPEKVKEDIRKAIDVELRQCRDSQAYRRSVTEENRRCFRECR